MNRAETLDRLLSSMFNRDELRLFLQYGDDGDSLVRVLPEDHVSPATWFSEVVRALERRGLIEDLWPRLQRERPQRRSDIDKVAALWMAAANGPSLLKAEEILAVADAITDAGLLRKRDDLLSGIARDFVERIPQSSDRVVQCTNDVRALAQVVDGKFIRAWFDRALTLARDAHDALRELRTRAVGRAVAGAFVDDSCSLTDRNPLVMYWARLEGELQAAFSLASSQCRRDSEGKAGEPLLGTRYVFIALRRILPDPLGQLFEKLPAAAIDPPIETEVRLDLQVITAPLWPSACVRDALARLALHVPTSRYITPADLFIDIARFGTGESVQRLRLHGVSAAVIEDHVRALGIHPVLTDGCGSYPPDLGPDVPA